MSTSTVKINSTDQVFNVLDQAANTTVKLTGGKSKNTPSLILAFTNALRSVETDGAGTNAFSQVVDGQKNRNSDIRFSFAGGRTVIVGKNLFGFAQSLFTTTPATGRLFEVGSVWTAYAQANPPGPGPGPIPPTPTPGQAFTLTTNIETLPATGTAPANTIWTAPASITALGVALNTLQTGDVLNGGGTGNVLNATLTLGGSIPTISGIPTFNITNLVNVALGAGYNAALTTGLTTFGNINSVFDPNVTNINSALSTVNIAGTSAGAGTTLQANGTALAGTTNTVQVNLTGVVGGNINLASAAPSATNGYDIINIASTGINTIGALISGGSADATTLTGGSLTINGGAALANPIDVSTVSINGSALTGALSVGRLNATVASSSALSGAGGALNFVGSNNGTTLVAESFTLTNNDTLNGGTGTADTLILTGLGAAASNPVANATPFTATGFERLRVADTAGRATRAAVALNLANVSGVTNYLTNGVEADGAAANGVAITYNNVNFAAPISITATGNGAAGAQNLNSQVFNFNPISTFGTNDTASYTFGNGGVAVGTGRVVTSGNLTIDGIENLNFTFNDLSVDGAVGTNGSTFAGAFIGSAANARAVTVTSTGGSARLANAINIGTVGGVLGTVTSALINSTGAVNLIVNQAAGATVATTGAGNHAVAANVAGNAIGINGSAGTGAQTFLGNTGADVIIGGTGNDTITGAAGADRMTGGAGADRFVNVANSSVAQSATSAATRTTFAFANGIDTITDFGQTDVLTNVTAAFADLRANANVATTANAYNLFRGTFAGGVFTTGTAVTDTDVLGLFLTAASIAAGTTIAAGDGNQTSVLLLGANNVNFAAANFLAN